MKADERDGLTDVDRDQAPEQLPQDWLLELLISATNQGVGAGMGVTLFVGGTVISGTLIGGREYFELFGRSFSSETSSPFQETIDKLYPLEKENPEAAQAQRRRHTFIHLKNAQYYQGATEVRTEGGFLWRGRLSRVDGFVLGAMRSSALR